MLVGWLSLAATWCGSPACNIFTTHPGKSGAFALRSNAVVLQEETRDGAPPTTTNADSFESGTFPEAIVDPHKLKVQFRTTAGSFTVTLDRALSPNGVDRFVELVKDGHFTDMLFYRVHPGFLIQFGVAAEPAQQSKWDWSPGPDGKKMWVNPPIADEPNRAKFRAGSVSFAGNGENSRSCHLFIAMEPRGSERLGKAPWETTLGFVDAQTDRDGLEVMDRICRKHTANGYIYADPETGALQGALIEHGNAAAAEFPLLDRIESAEMIEC